MNAQLSVCAGTPAYGVAHCWPRAKRTEWLSSSILAVLTLSIAISPRFNIGKLAYGKNVDLRLEDLLILLLAILAVIARRPRIHGMLPGLIGAYFAIGALSTAIGSMAGWIEPVRATLYYAKEVELFVCFLIAFTYLRQQTCVKVVYLAFMAGGLINGLYALQQVLTGNYVGLAQGYYCVALIGEPTPFTVSAYFVLIALLGLSALDLPGALIKGAGLVCVALAGVGVIGGMSRASIIGGVLAVGAWLILQFLRGQGVLPRLLGVATLAIGIAMALLSYDTLLSDRSAPLAIKRVGNLVTGSPTQEYQMGRIDDIYVHYLNPVLRNPLFGLGKSITGTDLPGEAHNYYLRLICEVGLAGFVLFFCAIGHICRTGWRLFAGSNGPWQRAIGQWCFLSTLFLAVSAFAQDTFIVVRIAEMFWIMAALTLRSEQWQRQHLKF